MNWRKPKRNLKHERVNGMPSVKEIELEVDTSREYMRIIIDYKRLVRQMQEEQKRTDAELERANKTISEQQETINRLASSLDEYRLSEQKYQTLSTECETLLKCLEVSEQERQKWKELAEELQK